MVDRERKPCQHPVRNFSLICEKSVETEETQVTWLHMKVVLTQCLVELGVSMLLTLTLLITTKVIVQ